MISDYYSELNLEKALISAFNKKQVVNGSFPIETSQESFDLSMKEGLSKNDIASRLIEKIPKSSVARQYALFSDLNSSNTYILKKHKHVSTLARSLITERIANNSGALTFSRTKDSFETEVLWLVIYSLKNRLTIIYNSDFQSIGRQFFEEMLFGLGHNQLDQASLSNLTYFMGILSFEPNKLKPLLETVLIENKSLTLSRANYDYLIDTLKNTSKSLSVIKNFHVDSICQKTWKNSLTILSYSNLTDVQLNESIKLLIKVSKYLEFIELPDTVNHFLVAQHNRRGIIFEKDLISQILSIQLSKINPDEPTSPFWGKQLVNNALYFLTRGDEEKGSDLNPNSEIHSFILKLDEMQLKERTELVGSTLLTIYELASPELKQIIEPLFKSTYNEIDNEEYPEWSRVTALRLALVLSIDSKKIECLLSSLMSYTTELIEKKSSTSGIGAIEYYVKKLPEENLSNNQELLANLASLVASWNESIDFLVTGTKRDS